MNEQVESNKGLSKGFWIILVAVVLLLVIGSAAVLYFLVFPNMNQEKVFPVYQIPLDSFTVNLKDSNYRRFLRTEITLETNEKKVVSELTKKLYKVRDSINTVLSDKSVNDLDDREAIKQELIDAINIHLVEGDVVGIYFNVFIVQ